MCGMDARDVKRSAMLINGEECAFGRTTYSVVSSLWFLMCVSDSILKYTSSIVLLFVYIHEKRRGDGNRKSAYTPENKFAMHKFKCII